LTPPTQPAATAIEAGDSPTRAAPGDELTMNDIAQTAQSEAETTERRVIAILARLLDVSPRDLEPEMPFEELGIDSADFIEIQLMLIEEFDIELASPQDAAGRVQQIRDLVALVDERVAETA
jgi:acyl carrier protein